MLRIKRKIINMVYQRIYENHSSLDKMALSDITELTNQLGNNPFDYVNAKVIDDLVRNKYPICNLEDISLMFRSNELPIDSEESNLKSRLNNDRLGIICFVALRNGYTSSLEECLDYSLMCLQ